MVDEQWDKDMLTGKTGPMEGKGGADAVKKDAMLWGRAGHLTEEQADVYVSKLYGDKSNILIFES